MARNRRQQIIDLASEKFWKSGFYKISMDSLVDELRISKSTLYKYFPSKEDLVKATVEKYTSRVDQQFEELLAKEDLGVIEIVESFTRFYSRALSQISDQYLREIELNYPEYWDEEVAGRLDRFVRYFGRIYDIGIEEGIFRPDMRKDIVVFIYAKITEIPYMKYMEHLNIPPQDVFDTISDLFFRGVLTEKGIQELEKSKYDGHE